MFWSTGRLAGCSDLCVCHEPLSIIIRRIYILIFPNFSGLFGVFKFSQLLVVQNCLLRDSLHWFENSSWAISQYFCFASLHFSLTLLTLSCCTLIHLSFNILYYCWRCNLPTSHCYNLQPPASDRESYPFNHLPCYRRQQGHRTLRLSFNVHVVCGIISGQSLIFQPCSLLSVHLAQCVSTAGVNKDLCCQKEPDCRSRSAREKVCHGGLDWCRGWLLCVHHAANLPITDLSPSVDTQKKTFHPLFFSIPLSYSSPSSLWDA